MVCVHVGGGSFGGVYVSMICAQTDARLEGGGRGGTISLFVYIHVRDLREVVPGLCTCTCETRRVCVLLPMVLSILRDSRR